MSRQAAIRRVAESARPYDGVDQNEATTIRGLVLLETGKFLPVPEELGKPDTRWKRVEKTADALSIFDHLAHCVGVVGDVDDGFAWMCREIDAAPEQEPTRSVFDWLWAKSLEDFVAEMEPGQHRDTLSALLGHPRFLDGKKAYRSRYEAHMRSLAEETQRLVEGP